MFMSESYYYLLRKLLYMVVFLLRFSKLSPNICSKSSVGFFSASCASPHTDDVATLPTSMHNKHARMNMNTHTHKPLL